MGKDYYLYTEIDFIADAYFQQWVKNPDAENTAHWEAVAAAWPQKAGMMMAARSFIENLQFQNEFPARQQTESSLLKSLRTIADAESAGVPAEKPSLRRRRFYFAAAAAVLLCIGTGAWFLLQKQKPVTIETIAGIGEIRKVVLPDSSVVTLNAGSHLTYAPQSMNGSHREVWLEGEGFFHVKKLNIGKEPSRFTVHSGDMDIEVLGTSFNVKKVGSFTNVSLNSGSVKIGLKGDPQTAIYLRPGDFVRYSSEQKHILKKQVKPELYSVWKEEKLTLDHMSLGEIAKLLEDSYGYTIHITDAGLAKTEVSGTLVMKDEATLLKTLATALDIDIIKKDSVLNFQFKHKN